MLAQPASLALATTSPGGVSRPRMRPFSLGVWAMSAFWQKRQEKLQPMAAME